MVRASQFIQFSCVLFLLTLNGLQSCSEPAPKPGSVTITFIDQVWVEENYRNWRDEVLQQFTRETGIGVKLLHAPESVVEQLALWRQFLENGSSAPDVYGIDVIWSGILARHLLDLKPYLAQDVPIYFSAVAASNTVDGRIIALPYRIGTGLLYYRSDLLREYGYQHPPATWDELELMAAQIQAGERAKGKKNFWGYVWQGANSEALTCNALEWQASEGGGRIIEEDGTISVNNPQTIRAWRRAARWVGTISPPSVVEYREFDTANIWLAGNAAFMRDWPSQHLSQAEESPVRGKFDVTCLPSGKAGRAAALGASSLSVSRYSLHPRESVALVRFLTRPDVQLRRYAMTFEPPTIPALYQEASMRELPYARKLQQALDSGVVSRPSTVTGMKYAEVSEAYSKAVHAVLTGDKKPGEAVAELEKQLVQITGLGARAGLYKQERSRGHP